LGGFGVSFARNSFHPAARNETLFEAASLQTGLQGQLHQLMPRQLMLQRRLNVAAVPPAATHRMPPILLATTALNQQEPVPGLQNLQNLILKLSS
jgi:hypothetical protein